MKSSILKALMGGIGLLAGTAHGQYSAFTYQGEIRESDAPANGTFDLRFSLFNAATGGSQVALTQCADNVQVVNGRFTVELDFGGLNLQPLFVEISVRRDTGLDCSDTMGYTSLAPRQKIAITPFAATSAFSLNTQQLDGQSSTYYRQASNLIGTIPSGSFSGTYTNAVTLTSSFNTFTGNGSAIFGINASNISSGTLTDARLSSNVAFLNHAQNFTGANGFTGATSFFSTTMFQGQATFNGGIAIPETTRALTIPCAAFRPASTASDMSCDGSLYRGLTAGQQVMLEAPIYLPNGAVVTQLDAFLVDSDTSQGMSVQVLRMPLNTSGGTQSLCAVGTTAASASLGVQTQTAALINNATIDTSSYAYYVRAIWTVPPTPADMSIHAVKLTYKITSPLP